MQVKIEIPVHEQYPLSESYSKSMRERNKKGGLPVMTMGGATSVLMRRSRTKQPTMTPKRLMRSMSVIFTALAERTRNITEILKDHECFKRVRVNYGLGVACSCTSIYKYSADAVMFNYQCESKYALSNKTAYLHVLSMSAP